MAFSVAVFRVAAAVLFFWSVLILRSFAPGSRRGGCTIGASWLSVCFQKMTDARSILYIFQRCIYLSIPCCMVSQRIRVVNSILHDFAVLQSGTGLETFQPVSNCPLVAFFKSFWVGCAGCTCG